MGNIKKVFEKHGIWVILVIAINLIIVSELFVQGNKLAIFDGNAHIVTLAQFYKALKDGEFPVMWADGFANYGLPLGTIAHQVPAYLGALFTFFTNSPLIAFYLVCLFAALMSALGFYFLASMVVSPTGAFVGTFLYSLSSYRLINIYVRGAIPELLSTIWLPLIMIMFLKMKKRASFLEYVTLTLLLCGMFLTHPMSIVLYSLPIFIIVIFIFKFDREVWLKLLVSAAFALLLSAYYLLPLQLESKYLYISANKNNYVYNQAVTTDSFLKPNIRYSCSEDNYIMWRCPYAKVGPVETTVFVISILLLLVTLFNNFGQNSKSPSNLKKVISLENRGGLFGLALTGAIITLIFSSQFLEPLYLAVPILGSIQIPSRFLAPFYFFNSLLLAILIDSIVWPKLRVFLWCLVISFLVYLQFPLIYGKNYIYLTSNWFYFQRENYHGLMLQPKWTINSFDYPVYRQKGEITQGVGTITARTLKNASRKYTIEAQTDVVINDHTFYFPGWNVYIDGNISNIEFQDPAYRGVITFRVPQGRHEVLVIYEDTKVRKIGKYTTVVTFVLGVVTVLAYLFIKRRAKRE